MTRHDEVSAQPVEPRVLVVGAGRWGANHIRTWHELGHLHAVVELDPGRRDVVQQAHPTLRVFADLEAALGWGELDAVVVAVPPSAHAAVAVAALESGCHVLIEKPLAIDVRSGEQIVDAAQRSGRVAMVGHVLEYHPAIVALRSALTSGVLGKLRYLYSNRLNFGTIRTEENALWSFAPHDVALFLGFAGVAAHEVACTGGTYLSNGVADVTLMSLAFPNDVRGHIFVSWLHPFKEQRFVVVGDREMAVFDDTAPWESKLVLYRHEVEWQEGRLPQARPASGRPVELESAEPLRRECEHFIDAIRQRRSPRTSVHQGLAVLRILEAGQRSLERGGSPQSLALHEHAPSRVAFHTHPTATIDDGALIGDNTRIWHYSHVMPGCRIGSDCSLGQNTFVASRVKIGDRVKLQNNVSVYEGVELEDDVFCGPSVVFTNVINPRSEVDRKSEFRPTLVRRGASLGANCTVVCGVTIGAYAFVAAGAVVTTDVPDHALVMGVPARLSGWRCRCGESLVEDGDAFECRSCHTRYVRNANAGLAITAPAAS
jgi:UDP-2-acetamido-3-amino-2,3-dideoxy-glucuronate N-acetyltransferase